MIGSPECNFSTGTDSGVPCDSTHHTLGQFAGRGNTPLRFSARRLLEEHTDARDQPVVAALEQDALGPLLRGSVDDERLGQLDEGQPGGDVRDPLYRQLMALQGGEDLAQVGDVVRLALDDVAERAFTYQTVVGDRCRETVPIVRGKALQVALDNTWSGG